MTKISSGHLIGIFFLLIFCESAYAQHPMGYTTPNANPSVTYYEGDQQPKSGIPPEDINIPPTRVRRFPPIKNSSEINLEGPKKAAGLRSNIQTKVVKQKEERSESTKSYNQSGATAPIDPKKRSIIRMNQSRQMGVYAPVGVLTAVDKTIRLSNASQGNYSGDRKTDRQEIAKIKTAEQTDYAGALPMAVYQNKNQKLRKLDNELGNYAGAGDYGSIVKRDKHVRVQSKEIADYSGALDGDALQRKDRIMREHELGNALLDPGLPDNYLENRDKKRRLKDKEQANNEGDIDGNYLTNRDQMRRSKDKEQATNSGDIGGNYLANREKMRRVKDKEQANNTGDIPLNYLLARNQMRRKRDKELSEYKGDILVSSIYEKERSIRKKSKEIANWQGDIIVNYKKKGMHPSAAYQGGKIQNSYEAKERLRKQVLKKYGKSKDFEIPNYEKKKEQKPTYDPKEAEIWY